MTIHIQRYIDYTLTRTSDQSPFTVRNVYIVHCTWVSYKCVNETLRSYANTESDRIAAAENNVKHVSLENGSVLSTSIELCETQRF